MPMREFIVRRITDTRPVIGQIIDQVFFAPNECITADDVRRSLIEHDNYPPDIKVTERK